MEKYGTVPKRFSKDWWPYFWMYYKWQTLGVIFGIILIAVTAVQCAGQIDYDLTVTMVPEASYSDETLNEVVGVLRTAIDDNNGDGAKQVLIQEIPLSAMTGQENQYTYGMMNKLNLELQAGETYVFILHESVLSLIDSMEGMRSCFEQAAVFAPQDIDESRLVIPQNGDRTIAVRLDGNRFLEELGYHTQNMCMVVRSLYPIHENDKDHAGWYRNAVKAAQYLLTGQDTTLER